MIFSKPINQITFEDVVRFANGGIKEGINLDYKRDFSSDHLNRTIASFANTHGGTIIVGLDDEDGKPKLPATGMEFQEGLHERVVQICVHSISPPVSAEINVANPVEGKTFVIIRVPESVSTPHAINGGEDVYIRTDNISKLEKRATVDRIEWLLTERRKSKYLKTTIIQRVKDNFEMLRNPNQAGVKAVLYGKTSLIISPSFPYEPLTTPQEMMDDLQNIRTRVGDREFPLYSVSPLEPIQDGVCLYFNNESINFHCYQEFNQFGIIADIENLAMQEEVQDGEKVRTIHEIYETTLFDHIHVFLKGVYNFYEKYGYWGNLSFNISIEDVVRTYYNAAGMYHTRQKVDVAFLPMQYTFGVASLDNPVELRKLMEKIITDISWSFRHKIKLSSLGARLTAISS